jgi:hypothetical protein
MDFKNFVKNIEKTVLNFLFDDDVTFGCLKKVCAYVNIDMEVINYYSFQVRNSLPDFSVFVLVRKDHVSFELLCGGQVVAGRVFGQAGRMKSLR